MQNRIIGCVVTLTDFTVHKRYEQQLYEKNAELERFAYTISHDLKSPLITIQNYAGMISKDIATGNHERAQDDIEHFDSMESELGKGGSQYGVHGPSPGIQEKLWIGP